MRFIQCYQSSRYILWLGMASQDTYIYIYIKSLSQESCAAYFNSTSVDNFIRDFMVLVTRIESART